jgi:carbon storage regulator CsrA
MLVIRCREGESVSIGSGVRLSILSIEAGRVKLGFVAPPEVPVTRNCAELNITYNRQAIESVRTHSVGYLAHHFAGATVDRPDCIVAVGANKGPKSPKQSEIEADKSSDDSNGNRCQGRTPDGT